MIVARWLMLGLLAFAPVSASARHSQTSKVRYTTQNGQSKWYDMDVTYMAGTELNTATNSFRFGGFDKYAVIFWDKDQVSIIKLGGYLICGLEFEQSCLPFTGRMKGVDQEEREWEVCTSSYC